jgi:hypothetical protein
MPEHSRPPEDESAFDQQEKRGGPAVDRQVRVSDEDPETFAGQLQHRRVLEKERLAEQTTRAERSEAGVLVALGLLTGAASIVGLSASVAAVPALGPALIFGAGYMVSKLFSRRARRTGKPTPPVLASARETLARDREIIRCFSLGARSIYDGDLQGDH